MTAAAVRSRRAKARTPPLRVGWWGKGPAPWKRWPGVTIEIPAVWSAKRKRWESPDRRYYFDAEAAQRAVDFFPTFLKHHKGEFADQPFALLAFQDQLIVRPVFGWRRASDGLRRFRKVFQFVAKGNGKSPLGAGLGLLLLYCDGEEGPEVYAAAADRDQARIVFGTAKVMVEGDADLSARARVYMNAIEVPEVHGIYRVLSSDVKTKHGFNVHGLVIDELHAQPNRDLYEVLDKGTVKRRQPLTVLMSTAGDDDEGICYEEYDYAKKIISGTITDETYLPVVFEMHKDDDWRDERNWPKANPGLGVTVKLDGLRAMAQAAANEPRKLNDFLRYHGNRWVSGAVAWIPPDQWDACPEVDAKTLETLPTLQVASGLDLAQKWDLAAFSAVFRIPLEKALAIEVATEDEAGQAVTATLELNYRVVVLQWFWIPEDTAREHEKRDRVPYLEWAKRGWVMLTPGMVIDTSRIVRDIKALAVTYPLLKQGRLGYDPAFATEPALALQGAGFNTGEVLQNYKFLSEPSQVLEAFIRAKRVTRTDSRLMRWNVENVMVKQDDAGRIRPVKPKKHSNRKRVDGVVATVMGLSGIMMPSGPTGTAYAEREPAVLTDEEIEAVLAGEAPPTSERRFFDHQAGPTEERPE